MLTAFSYPQHQCLGKLVLWHPAYMVKQVEPTLPNYMSNTASSLCITPLMSELVQWSSVHGHKIVIKIKQ